MCQLTDDNGDTVVDATDSPDVVYLMSPSGGGAECNLVAVHGEDRQQIFRVTGRFRPFSDGLIGPLLAAANLDADGAWEVLTTDETALRIYDADGSLLRSEPWPAYQNVLGHSLSVADLNQDGTPEVYSLSDVVSLDGRSGWVGAAGGLGGGINS